MNKNINLLEGSIPKALAKLAFPIMATSLITMAYNLVDMIWIGRVSSGAVAAVGAGGMYLWLSAGVATIPKMGGQITVAQSMGAGEQENSVEYARAALQLGTVFGILFGLMCILFRGPLIAFLGLNSPEVVRDAEHYLMITGGSVIFAFTSMVLTGIVTAMGNSAVIFRSNSVGLIVNIILDPILIFGLGPLPEMGAVGAAVATVLAQIIVVLMFLQALHNEPVIFKKIKIMKRTGFRHFCDIIRIGFPVSIQSMLFTGISMIIARMIAGWGDAAIAVQKVGSQIESISWMTAEGFASAVNAFIAQNYGAGKKERIKKGYQTAIGIMVLWGLFATFVLLVFPEQLFSIFINEADVIPMGVDYLRIVAFSQVFMCVEITTAGAFQGMGKTIPPAIEAIILTGARIPVAIVLGATVLGLNGIWITISLSATLKGIVLPIWFVIVLKHYLRDKDKSSVRTLDRRA